MLLRYHRHAPPPCVVAFAALLSLSIWTGCGSPAGQQNLVEGMAERPDTDSDAMPPALTSSDGEPMEATETGGTSGPPATTSGAPHLELEWVTGSGGSSSTSEVTSSTETDSTGASPGSELEQLSDEFEDAASLSAWTILSEYEGLDLSHEALDIDQSSPGKLTVIPLTGGWFESFMGPFLFKEVTGDFMVETLVIAGSRSNIDAPPTSFYNSAGLLVRDPASPPVQNWVTHNVGMQSDIGVATENKSTVDSTSHLRLFPGLHQGRLRICRVGSVLIMARRLDDESEFIETTRYDLGFPETVQVGLIANGWNSLWREPDFQQTPDLVAEFEYIRFYEILEESECLEPRR